jgi:hypothetical protein
MVDSVPEAATKSFPCDQCGAKLAYSPGSGELKCPYCGFENKIPQSVDEIQELDFSRYLEIASKDSVPEDHQIVRCPACSAVFTTSGTTISDTCPFCGSPTLLPLPAEVRLRPQALLPFRFTVQEAAGRFERWVRSRRLAPRALRLFARAEGGLQGIYVPYWTYDCNTKTAYTGLHEGINFQKEIDVDSQGKTREHEVLQSPRHPAAGVVFNEFNDLLVPASQSLRADLIHGLHKWDLGALVPYQDSYLSGFRAERYQVGLEEGFEEAKAMMEGDIESSIERDIGGKTPRILTQKTQYDRITFKHILLPIYLGVYEYRGKRYLYLVNARTGEVRGKAPISVWKICALVLAVALLFGTSPVLKLLGY